MISLLFQASIINISSELITGLITTYGYLAIFVLMTLEAAAFPVPSEIVLPAVGYFAAAGNINLFFGFVAALLGGILGMAIDFYLAYFLGKAVVYKHLNLFHIKKTMLLDFERWFAENGDFVVFISRLLPVVRAIMNFPAGFAEMSQKKFFVYSIAGTIIWDAILIGFGYYAQQIGNVYLLSIAIAALSLGICVLYFLSMRNIRKRKFGRR
jgi:membrane protein DedA with SNARE-associated domain